MAVGCAGLEARDAIAKILRVEIGGQHRKATGHMQARATLRVFIHNLDRAMTHFADFTHHHDVIILHVMYWGPRDYWFPEIHSLGGGAALMLTLVLYPYVYLLARASFRMQAATPFYAARSLGSSPTNAFLLVSLPIAQPAIAGGQSSGDYGNHRRFRNGRPFQRSDLCEGHLHQLVWHSGSRCSRAACSWIAGLRAACGFARIHQSRLGPIQR
jgi:hypothetical protein